MTGKSSHKKNVTAEHKRVVEHVLSCLMLIFTLEMRHKTFRVVKACRVDRLCSQLFSDHYFLVLGTQNL